jgi:phospho-N-acetylmuramoyl-pentapeptide-transferase
MLLWLLQHYGHLLEQVTSRTTGDSRVFLTARIATSSIIAFLLSIALGPTAIRWLKKRFRERIASASETLNQLHANKQETPTMGGLFVMAAVMLSTVLCADLCSTFVQLAMFVVICLTMIGGYDDWVKQRTKRNGLSAWQKLIAQMVTASIAGYVLYTQHSRDDYGAAIVWPLGNLVLVIGPLFIVWSAFVIVGAANGVNLTDGLDGLAAGCTVFCGGALAGLAYLCGRSDMSSYLSIPHVVGCGELAVVLGALVGAMLGFLWFNCHPAEVFMGDAGSLPTGGLLAVVALVSRQELLLAIFGGIFVVETLSVVLQVGCFRLTGRRPLRCSPLHNHFVFRGDNESRIVIRFWIVSALLAIVGIASLKLR